MHELIFVAAIVLFFLLMMIMCSKPGKKEIKEVKQQESKHGDSVWSEMQESGMTEMTGMMEGMTGMTGPVIMITRDDSDLTDFLNKKAKVYTEGRGVDIIYTTNQRKGMNKFAKVVNMKSKDLKTTEIKAESGVTLVTVDYRYVGTMMRELGHDIKELDPENTCRVYIIKGDKLIVGCQSENLTCQK